MRKYSYHFEQLDLITLFVAAFDDAFLYRYDAATREAKERVDVRYVFGPKHRVLHDLTDRSKTLTLPVVTIEQTGLSRDTARIHNKSKYFTQRTLDDTGKISKVPTPVPVNLSLTVNIIGKFKQDIDQIVQNFVAYCNPYIIAYWKVPEDFGMDFINELRSEIQWSGDISYDNPKDLSPDTKWRISAETTFTIKGWLFPPMEQQQEPIYTVRTEFQAVNLQNRVYTYDDFAALSGNEYQTEVITVSAYPEFTNAFYSNGNIDFPIHQTLVINGQFNNEFKFYGKRFGYNNAWYLSSGETNFTTDYQMITTVNSPTISAYRISDSYVSVDSDNIVTITVPPSALSAWGEFKFVTSNECGWATYPDTTLFNWTTAAYYSYELPDGSGLYVQPDGDSLYIRPMTIQDLIYFINNPPIITSGYAVPDGSGLYYSEDEEIFLQPE